jgi:hypothetical protein
MHRGASTDGVEHTSSNVIQGYHRPRFVSQFVSQFDPRTLVEKCRRTRKRPRGPGAGSTTRNEGLALALIRITLPVLPMVRGSVCKQRSRRLDLALTVSLCTEYGQMPGDFSSQATSFAIPPPKEPDLILRLFSPRSFSCGACSKRNLAHDHRSFDLYRGRACVLYQ